MAGSGSSHSQDNLLQTISTDSGLHSAYLTRRQLQVWNLTREGLTQSQIATRLRLTRQDVHFLARQIHSRVTSALTDAAKLCRVDPKEVDARNGILFGWCRELQAEAVIGFNSEQGLSYWVCGLICPCPYRVCDRKRHQ